MKSLAFLTLTVLVGLTLSSDAEVPRLINYQGFLTNPSGNPVGNGDYEIIFSIYDVPSGGTPIWTSGQQTVSVNKGMFLYSLGSAVSLPLDLFETDTLRWLGIKVDADDELAPRTRFVSVPYAYHALVADTAKHVLNASGIWWYEDSSSFANLISSPSGGGSANVLARNITIPAGLIKRHFRICWSLETYDCSGCDSLHFPGYDFLINGQQVARWYPPVDCGTPKVECALFFRSGPSPTTYVYNESGKTGKITIDPTQPVEFRLWIWSFTSGSEVGSCSFKFWVGPVVIEYGSQSD